MQRSLTVITAVIVLAVFAVAQESAPKTRLQQVEEEVARRRKMLEAAHGERGIVFAPLAHPEEWFHEPRELRISSSPLVTCGQTFATLARREVMISGRIAQKIISVSTERVVSEKALQAFRSALEAEGIAIIPIGLRILALVDKPDAPK